MRDLLVILEQATPSLVVGAKVKGKLFVTSKNNMEFWGGYLPGAGQYGKWFPVTVLITEAGEDGVMGVVRLRKVKLAVYCDDETGAEWSIHNRATKHLTERACKTPGAIYDINISDQTVGVTARLPDAVAVPDMSDKDAKKYEDKLHDALEEIVAKMFADLDPEAKKHWQNARDNDISERLTEDRKKGKSLPETGYKDSYAVIYRGVLAEVTTFQPMDYVTMNRRWAIQHAEHVEAVEDQPAHVLRAMVPAKHVFEAYNPGEFFYDGPAIPGRPIRS